MEPTIQIITATTGSSQLDGVPQAVIELSNGCFARTFGTSTWTHIRLAMRYRFITTSSVSISTIYGTPYKIGFCHGTDHIPGDEYVDHFLGTGMPEGGTLAAYSPTNYRLDTTYLYYATSASGYQQGGAWGSTYGRDQVTVNTASSIALFVDLKKAPIPNRYSASIYTFDNDYVLNRPDRYAHYSNTTFLIDIQDASPARTSYSQLWETGAWTIDETASGSFDSVCAYWGRDEPKMQILELYVVRLA